MSSTSVTDESGTSSPEVTEVSNIIDETKEGKEKKKKKKIETLYGNCEKVHPCKPPHPPARMDPCTKGCDCGAVSCSVWPMNAFVDTARYWKNTFIDPNPCKCVDEPKEEKEPELPADEGLPGVVIKKEKEEDDDKDEAYGFAGISKGSTPKNTGRFGKGAKAEASETDEKSRSAGRTSSNIEPGVILTKRPSKRFNRVPSTRSYKERRIYMLTDATSAIQNKSSNAAEDNLGSVTNDNFGVVDSGLEEIIKVTDQNKDSTIIKSESLSSSSQQQ